MFDKLTKPLTKMAGSLLVLAAASLGAVAQSQILVAGVTEASGPGAPAGTSFKNGYLMAIDEINTAGGILGKKIELRQADIETSPDAAKAAVAKAVEMNPFAIFGPVFSGLTAASMGQTADKKIPQFTGGEAASLTRKFHPSLLRTSMGQLGSAPRIAALATYGLAAKKIGMITIDNEFGRDGRAALANSVKRNSATLVFDKQVKPGQKDMLALVEELLKADVDALVVYATENETAAVLRQLKLSKFAKPVVCDGLAAAPKVVEGAEGGTEGVYIHMVASPAVNKPPVQGFVSRYTAKYGVRPDINSIKGYTVVQTLKAGIEITGKVDRDAFLNTIKNQRLDNAKYPELLSPVTYDFFGDINRETYYAVIRDGAPRILASIRVTEGGAVEMANGKSLTLNSNEFRAALKEEPKPDNTQKGKR